jgi:hypothetical protein
MTLMREGYSKFGEVFTVPVLHKNITFLIGPHVTPHFFKARDDQLSQTEVSTARLRPCKLVQRCRVWSITCDIVRPAFSGVITAFPCNRCTSLMCPLLGPE